MVKAVISGSYHRDSEGLRRLFVELETCGVRVLAPLSLDLDDASEAVVKQRHDGDMDVGLLEQLHLRAIREADILFVHAPGGYVGVSTSFEIGYAVSRDIPVVSIESIADEMLQTVITKQSHVFGALIDLGLLSTY